MGTPYMGEIKLVSFNFPPKGWAFCNGQFLPINQNQALFSLLGTTYGGDGRTTFALPDLRGRVPAHEGNSLSLGERLGGESHTITQSELPTHTHLVNANATPAPDADGNVPRTTRRLAASVGKDLYAAPGSLAAMAAGAVGAAGGSQPHENRQPYLVLNFCIALQGIFPSRN